MPQFLGMYRLTVDGVETYMVVTRNVFSHRLTVHRKYDLKVKGSVAALPRVGRAGARFWRGRETRESMCLILTGQRLFEVQMTVTRGYLSYHIYGTVDVLQLLSVGRARRGQRFRDRLC